MLRVGVLAFSFTCLAFTIFQYCALLGWSALSGRLMRQHRAGRRPVAVAKTTRDAELPGVSIVMPAYNEQNVIVDTTVSALAQEYPHIEVVVVNDGSKDDTMKVLIERFELEVFEENPVTGPIETKPIRAIYRSRREPRIVVVDKAPSGAKADGSNAGINVARHPWVVIMDADEFMERDTIARCMVEAVAAPETVVAVGGTLMPANDLVVSGPDIVERHAPKNYWVGCQTIEYLTAFLVARPGMASIGAMPIVSGGFGLYRRDVLLEVGGYRHGHLGEDMDMCLRVQRLFADRGEPYRIAQVPESLCWTEFPSTKAVLQRQRVRWHRGLRTIIGEYKSMIGRRRYGPVGSVGMGSLVVFEWIGPLLEALGWFAIAGLLLAGWVSPVAATAVFLATQMFGMVLSMVGVMLMTRHLQTIRTRRDLLRLIGWSFAFNWGYRQITLIWRIRSLFPGATGWGAMPRAGFKSVAATQPS
jgi:cellulose synthase/poly-beta-1,6-N-acetylglucosamine synthase-like glycosyltransferase